MIKHNSKLEARMFEDGTTPAISLNPVLSAAASTEFDTKDETFFT